MNFCKKAVSWLLAFGLILGSANMTVQAEETTQYSHGTVGITSDAADSTNVISLKKGETATVSISPYIHVQYKGCGKEKCPASCEEEYGVPCFEVGNGCKCDQTPTTRTAEVAATAADPAVAAVSTEVAAQTAGETVGSQAAGSLTITAQTAGETTVAVSAKLQDWVTAEVVYTVKVTEEEVKAEIPELVEGYYQIDSEQDLKWFAEQVNSDNTVNNSLNAQITADITLTEAYVPIAPSKAHTYSGTIDGNGHTITFANGIAAKTTINDKSVTITCEGLVGNAAGATIKNLTIAGTIDVTASKNYAAAFVGVVTGSSVNVTNCINKANITDSVLASTTGGIVGYALSSDVNISNCINYGNITTNAVSKSLAYTGGILGKGSSSLINITNCGNEGTVSS
ncbi:MAG: hypothetical protein J6M22_02195, partial [Firmicutes bacterium]|nr:hypothetical protein [Bacillota bacterium]